MMYNYKSQKNCFCNNDSIIEEACDNVVSESEYTINNCTCGFDEEDSPFPYNYMYGQSYVPYQQMKKTFTPEVGLKMGTIFPELVSPYRPCQSIEEIEYIKATNTIKEGCNKC